MKSNREQNYVVIEFHGDGGQACTEASRTFTNNPDGRKQAVGFARRSRNESGHHCGHSSVRIRYSKDFIPDRGF